MFEGSKGNWKTDKIFPFGRHERGQHPTTPTGLTTVSYKSSGRLDDQHLYRAAGGRLLSGERAMPSIRACAIQGTDTEYDYSAGYPISHGACARAISGGFTTIFRSARRSRYSDDAGNRKAPAGAFLFFFSCARPLPAGWTGRGFLGSARGKDGCTIPGRTLACKHVEQADKRDKIRFCGFQQATVFDILQDRSKIYA